VSEDSQVSTAYPSDRNSMKVEKLEGKRAAEF
jgi:hypothetical protein